MKRKFTPIVENVAESTAACLVTMVQGNILAIGLGHWLVASQTGVVAGLVASAAIVATQTDKRWVISLLLGAITAVVDFFMHPGGFGPVFMEALVTGIGAAFLSYIVGSIYRYIRSSEPATE
jgi:hypothetical protein